MKIELKTKAGENITLTPYKMNATINDRSVYELMDEDNKQWVKLVKEDSSFTVQDHSTELEDFDKNFLDDLFLKIIEEEQSGVENNDYEEEITEPFNPQDIKVHSKQFNMQLVVDMIEDGDIDLSPDFQRNNVWNSFQKSRLIESILLRIPLPMFYFSEDTEGRITVVDGLQRLTTIKEFVNNEFPLRNLEYLGDSCEGKYFEDENKKIGLDRKYVRWFKQTQFSVNVIDPSSPAKVKYDIFRRINTGGKPLNNQEIRNCLAGNNFRQVLREMTNLPEFFSATDHSIKPRRMEDHEVASRFILFSQFEKYEDYNGYMDSSLDNLTENTSSKSYEELRKYVDLFSKGMKNAEYLFGSRYAFRKINKEDLNGNSRKKLINKALFTVWSVLLSEYEPEDIRSNNKKHALLEPLTDALENNEQFFNYLSYGTNGRNNILYTFKKCKEIIENHITL